MIAWTGSVFAAALWVLSGASWPADAESGPESVVALPEPDFRGVRLEDALRQRRSVRSFSAEPLTLSQISQLLWAGQGVTSADGRRAAPSAGALYPLELYVAAGRVDGLETGIYHYRARHHDLELVVAGDPREGLARASLRQESVQEASAVIVVTAVRQRTWAKYGARGDRYVHIEVGHAAQNVWLQAVSLGLGSVMVGAFDDDLVARLLHLPEEARPLALLPVGLPR